MKKNYITICTLVLVTSLLNHLIAQNLSKPETAPTLDIKAKFIAAKEYLKPSNSLFRTNTEDSLIGFNESSKKIELAAKHVFGLEYDFYIAQLKRNFINQKYKINQKSESLNAIESLNPKTNVSHTQAPRKTIGGNAIINVTPCVNEDFELSSVGAYTAANAVTGWSLSSMSMSLNTCSTGTWTPGSSEFSIMATPVAGFGPLGTVTTSPLGGTKVARINNNLGNASKTRISTNFPVTSANNLFQYAYTGYFDDGGHFCCEGAGFTVRVLNGANQEVLCLTNNYDPCMMLSTYTLSGSLLYTNWLTKSIDLSAFIGGNVTIECWVNDCAYGGHVGTMLFDASCGQTISGNLTPVTNITVSPVSFCPGSGLAVLTAPPGFISYLWQAPGSSPSLAISQSTLSSITVPVNFSVSSAVYSVMLTNAAFCSFISTMVVSPSQTTHIGISGFGSTGSCLLGHAGSATVQAFGSNSGYNYAWLAPSNSVIATSSVATGLAPGGYTVFVSSPNNPACGMDSTIVTIIVASLPVNYYTKPFCNNTAYVSITGGTNYQWYNGAIPISAPSGTLSSLAIPNLLFNTSVSVGRDFLGCRDSTVYNMVITNPNIINLSNFVGGCPGTYSGSAVVTIGSNNYTPAALNNYTVLTIGTPSLPYSSVLNNTSANSYTATGIPIGISFSVNVFDGTCISATTGIINPIVPAFNYSLIPFNYTVCQGASLNASVNFSSSNPSNQYHYLWTPNSFLGTNNSTLQAVVLNPTTALGTTNSIVYTVVVTPTAANCPLTKTLVVYYANPITPSISLVPTLCNNSGTYAINVNPTGGLFSTNGSNGSIGSTDGVITPSLTNIGINTFTYNYNLSNCPATASSSFVVNPSPNLMISGNIKFCSGETTNISVNGAYTYTWSTNSNSHFQVLSPTITTTYSVSGTDSLTGCIGTQIITLNVDDCVGLNHFNQNENTIHVYPNPGSGEFNIKSDVALEIQIFNQLGQVILEQKLNKKLNTINLKDFSKGVYYLKYHHDSISGTTRLVLLN